MNPSPQFALDSIDTTASGLATRISGGRAAEPHGEEPGGEATGGAMFLLFRVRGALFGIEAALAREIHGLPRLSPLHEAAPWVMGVLDLRGAFVAVVDLARRLGQAPRTPRPSDCLILLEDHGQRLGIVVDEVLHVVAVAPAQQEKVPNAAAPVAGEASPTHSERFVHAIAHVEGDTVMLLRVERLLQADSADAAAGKYLPAATGDLDRLNAPASSLFEFGASEAEQAVFAARAQRLAQRAASEEREGLSPFAVIGLGGEQFGIGLESVREFCAVRNPTPVPCCPPHIVGQMNLRGDILTLLDIRHLLHLPASPPAARTGTSPSIKGGAASAAQTDKVVVLESGGLLTGVLVDEVLDVLYLRASTLANAPTASPGVGGKYFNGGALYRDRMLGLLDLPRILLEGGLAVDEVV